MPTLPYFHSSASFRQQVNRSLLSAAIGIGLLAAASVALSGDPEFSARLSTELTLTDNARLSSSNKETDLILRLSPAIRAAGRGGRLDWNVSYAPNLVFYAANEDRNSAQSNLNAYATLEAVDNWLFVDGRATVLQTFENPFLPTPSDSTLATDNRRETYTLGLSPYIRGQLFGDYRYLVRNDNYYSNARNVSGDVFTNRLFGSIDSPVQQRLFYGADGSYDRTKFENRQSFTAQLVRGRIGLVITPELSLRASAGYEWNNYGLTDYSGSIYGVGFDWRPTPRTNVSGTWEERFFGPSYQATFSHRTRLTAWSLSGSRNTQTYDNTLLRLTAGGTRESLDQILTARITDPLVREAAIDQFMSQSGLPEFLGGPVFFYNQNIFLIERVDARFGILGVRNSFHVNAFYEESESITVEDDSIATDLFGRNVHFRSRGLGAAFTHRLGPRTNATLSLNRTYTTSLSQQLELITGRDATQSIARLSVTHALSPKTNVTGRLRIARYDSDLTSYDEHAIQALIFHRF